MNTVPRAKETEFKGRAVTLNKTEYIKGEGLKPEEYIIEISENGNACITYSDNAGRLYAEQTMKQLSSDGKRVPLCRIRDYPSFYYRGYMLDCARHMFTVDEITKLADAMALLKFNKFHWHLTDDQGWRIESERYPMLNSVSAVRKFSSFGKKKENSAYGRVYTKAEIKEVIEYCGEREIEVIPEFDIPGHTSALLAAFPELSCGKSEIEVKTHQGIFKDVICLSNEKSLEVILNIFDEICELFPGKYIHIGGDETPKAQWEACPECRNEMAKLGINGYKEYQNSFTNKVIEHLEGKGKTCIVWNDAAEGKNLDRRAIVQYWKEKSAPSAEFANSGGRLILSPFTYYYTDYDYNITPLNRTLSFKPEIRGLNEKSSVLGLEVPIWTEYIDSNERLEEMLFPRAAAVAETAWSGKTADYTDFTERFENTEKLLKQIGINAADKSLWKRSRASMPLGWLKFVKDNYSLEYIKWAIK